MTAHDVETERSRAVIDRYNVVTQGTITIEDGCRGAQTQTFGVGQAFETSEGRVHRAVNNGTVDEIEYNMFIGPQRRPITVQIPSNQQLCGPPSRVDECRNGGWATFDFPGKFENQGACILMLITGQLSHYLCRKTPS